MNLVRRLNWAVVLIGISCAHTLYTSSYHHPIVTNFVTSTSSKPHHRAQFASQSLSDRLYLVNTAKVESISIQAAKNELTLWSHAPSVQKAVDARIARYKTKTNEWPVQLIQEDSKFIKQEVSTLQKKLLEVQQNQHQLLDKIKLPHTTLKLTAAQERTIPSKFQHKYVHNELLMRKLELEIKIREQCLAYNDSKTKVVVSTLREVEERFKTQTPATQRCHILGREITHLEKYIKNEERLRVCQEELKVVQQTISKQTREKSEAALLFEQQSRLIAEISSLASQFGIKTDDLTLTDLTKISSILEGKKVIPLCREELTRLKIIDTFDQQCVRDYDTLNQIFKKATHKWGMGSDTQLAQAIAQATLATIPRSEVLYELTPEGCEYLRYCGEDPDKIQSFFGNTVQKELAQRLSGVINRLGKEQQTCIDLEVADHLKVMAHVTRTTIDVINKGRPGQAIGWTSLSGIFEHATTSMAKGVAQGFKHSAESYIKSPYDAAHEAYDACSILVHACKGDAKAYETVKTACINFAQLPADKKLENTVAFFTTILTADDKIAALTSFDKTIKGVTSLMKKEEEALSNLKKLTAPAGVLIKDVPVPLRWENTINRLIEQRRITTSEDVHYWVEHLEAQWLTPVNRALIRLAESVAAQFDGKTVRVALHEAAMQGEYKRGHAASMVRHESVASDGRVIDSGVLPQFIQTTQLVLPLKVEKADAQQLHYHYQQQLPHPKSSYAPYKEARVKALADTESAKAFCKTYELLPASEQWIKENGLVHYDWKTCNGSAIKVELHDEQVSILNKAAALQYQTKDERVRIATHTVSNVLKLAHEANARNALRESCALTDLGWALLDYGCAVGEGVLEGASRVGEAIAHPFATLSSFGNAAYSMAYMLCEYEAIGDVTNPLGEQWASKTLEDHGRKIDRLQKAIRQSISTMSGPDLVRAGTATVVEAWLTGRIAVAVEPIFSVAKSRVLEVIKKGKAPEAVLAGETEINFAVEVYDQLALMQADKAKRASTGVRAAAAETTQAEVKAAQAVKDVERVAAAQMVSELQSAKLLQDVELLKHVVDDTGKLQGAIKMFGENPTAISKDGPLSKLMECVTKDRVDVGKLGTARGAAYELEKGYELVKQGEKGVAFGNKYQLKNMEGIVQKTLDVDIETATKFIECKNWDWSKMSPVLMQDKIQKLRSGLPDLQKLAKSFDKHFEFHSKYPIPDHLKKWLSEKQILFFEG